MTDEKTMLPVREPIEYAKRLQGGPPDVIIVHLKDGTNIFLEVMEWDRLREMLDAESGHDLYGMQTFRGVDGAVYMLPPMDIAYCIYSTAETRRLGNLIQYLNERDRQVAHHETMQAETRLHAEAQGIPQADLDEHVQEIMNQRAQAPQGPRIHQP